MTMPWLCFVCASTEDCIHRETELVGWVRQMQRTDETAYLLELRRPPPTVERMPPGTQRDLPFGMRRSA